MRIMLAPMEGVVEHHVRDILTRLGGLDGCVTEFIRVTDQKLPYKVFYKYAQELENHCQTPNGTPVKVQLLGSKPEPMALNAQELVRYGAKAIDLNFGCPAKTVNSHEGGACLLRTPDRVYSIIKAVRDAVPRAIPVSAKIRLGFEDRTSYMENAQAVEAAGADELTVHARSKADGYKPPAYWHYIADIKAALKIPVIANGEIWSVEDYLRCREQSQCADVMLGRGLLSCPDLARQIKAYLAGEEYRPLTWGEVCQILFDYYRLTTPLYETRNCGNRVKQWLMYLSRQYPEANVFFEAVKRKTTPADIEACFIQAMDVAAAA
ncbi:tRNA dihydrouridine synthase [Cellvibrio japonicus]|uniref:tRNA-dihydrouridine(16) synthase n=1 Tax=Cellvibrio japonicus (strain Ueda107) TaxID=498211 RepID=B3PD21_CELJU|nr:tRNA-dihydrouridine synthase [Cellvibrio japonicus]ACE84639.1 dihydrouridine synthase family protein [Cellvibrio japonicus Ueda107]QEI11960.1 tRNA dihydrouridine(16) synthase DusC [Cellvibrio japonicus]QEI15534.1 tRNA dihydrouridine(16) synthase DusC [Cellvibrio japonicus]QEI19113.1 tRNA dihydrouridine(16) synthase DusC [Cellvibrio japonicus]